MPAVIDRYLEAELCEDPFFRFKSQVAAVFFHYAVANRQAEPGTEVFALCCEKRVEDFILDFFGDTVAAVFYGYSYPLGLIFFHNSAAKKYLFIFIVAIILLVQGVAGICQKVHQHLLDLLAAAFHLRKVFFDINAQLYLVVLYYSPYKGKRLADNILDMRF